MPESKYKPSPLSFSIRVLITAGITIGCYLSIQYLNHLWNDSETQFSLWPQSIEVLLCLPLGYSIWKNSKGDVHSIKGYQAIGGIILGGAGFILGIIIPLLMKMGDQGPLIGIVLTGPIGLILGVVFGGIYWKRKVSTVHKA